MNLKGHVFRGSLWSLFGSGGQQLISFLLFVYIARKLTPADVGLVAFAMVFVDVIGFAARWGQVEVLQRQPELSDRAASTSFWMLAAAGLLVSGAIIGGAETVRDFGGDASFAQVLMLLAPICALQAWNAVPEAVLRRRFNFRSLAFRTWLATLTGGLVGAYLAFHGYGVYALVFQRLITAFVQTLATWTMLRWHPRWAFDFADARRFLANGAEIMLAGLAGILNLRIADSVTGLVLGPTQLGYLRLGWRFFDLIVQLAVQPVSSVALSTFSRIQKDLPALRRAYLRLTQFMALASLPMFFGLGAIADIFIPLVFGPQWTNSVVVLQSIGFVMLAGTVNYFFGPVMIAVGKARVVLRQSIVQTILTVVLIYLGSEFGILGVLVAIIVRASLVALYNILALNRELAITPRSILNVLLPPIVASGVMVGVIHLARIELDNALSNIPLLAVLIVIGAVTYGLALLLGDVTGAWRGYVRGAVGSLAGAMTRRTGEATAGATPA